MSPLNAQVVTDAAGKPVGVFLDLAAWRALQAMLAELEELDDVQAFDQAVADPGGEAAPLEQAIDETERGRQLPPPAG